MALCALGLSTAPVGADAANGAAKCNGTINGGTIAGNVNVGNNAVCILNGVTVTGNVSVGFKAYFEANGSTIGGNVSGSQALTLYIWNHSNVSGNVSGYYTNQVFVYDSTVGKNVAGVYGAAPGYGHFQVCGSTVSREIGAAFVGPDILVGDPAAGCGGNTASDFVVTNNTADSELYLIGNTAKFDIGVYNNSGGGPGQVTGNNAPNGDLFCSGNSGPFIGSPNGSVGDVSGPQCSATTITGRDMDEV